MKKASTMMLYILVKIVGLLIVAAILMTFLFPKNGFTNIVLNGTLLDENGKPLSQKILVIYSGITEAAYTNTEEVATDSAGRFSAAFQKQYTITMLKSFLKLKQMAWPPFYFGIKLSDPAKIDGHYFVVKVTQKATSFKVANERDGTFYKKEVSKDISVMAKLYPGPQGWVINAIIRDGKNMGKIL